MKVNQQTKTPDEIEGDAHELWALAQLAPGEGISDAVDRIIEFLNKHYNR